MRGVAKFISSQTRLKLAEDKCLKLIKNKIYTRYIIFADL